MALRVPMRELYTLPNSTLSFEKPYEVVLHSPDSDVIAVFKESSSILK